METRRRLLAAALTVVMLITALPALATAGNPNAAILNGGSGNAELVNNKVDIRAVSGESFAVTETLNITALEYFDNVSVQSAAVELKEDHFLIKTSGSEILSART